MAESSLLACWLTRVAGPAGAALAILAGSAAAQTAPAAAPPPVAVAALPAPDLFSLGAPGPGLGPDLWTGSSGSAGAIARAVIPALSPRALSPAAATLAREVLSTGAQGPKGAGDDPALQAARLNALLTLGDAATMAAIADRSGPSFSRSEAGAHAAAEAYLALNRADAACAVGGGLQVGREGAYWLRLRSFCLAQGGKTAEAQLAYNLANQQRAVSRGAFRRLMGVRLAGSGDAGPASATDGLDYVLSRTLKLDLAPAMAAAPLSVQSAAAQDAALPPAARLVGAAYAGRADALPPGAARAAYLAGAAALAAGLSTSPPSVAEATGPRRGRSTTRAAPRAPEGLDVRAEAARFAAVQAAPDPARKIAALEELLHHAEDAAAFSALSRLIQPELGALAAAGGPLGERGRLFALASAAAGDFNAAEAFRAKLAPDGPNAVPAGDLALLDGAVAALSTNAPGVVLDHLADAAAAEPRRAQTMFAAIAVLTGENGLRSQPPTGETRARFAFADIGPAAASPARLLTMDAAAEATLKGDTTLMALAVAQASGSGAETLADRARIVRALVKTGMPQPAARFALEGLVELQRR